MACQHVQLSSYTEIPEVTASVSKTLLVMANLKAPELVQEEASRPAISVCAVVDRSGSMQGSKLTLTRQSLRFVIQNLTAEDEFGLVTYATTVKEPVKLRQMNAEGKRVALEAITAITADDCTNLSGGLFRGIDQLKEQPSVANAPSNTASDFPLVIGNERQASGPDATEALWTLFVRPGGNAGNISDLVQTVEFKMQGAKEGFLITQAPFESACPLGASVVDVHITLTAKHGSVTHVFQHIVNFLSSSTFMTVVVPYFKEPLPSSHPSAAHNEVKAVWLFTDGLANEGVVQREELATLTRQRLEGLSCGIFTFGFGNDHDSLLLKELADAGKGMYYFVEQPASIPEAFADCLGGLTSVVARQIKLTARACPGTSILNLTTMYNHEVGAEEAWVVIPDLYSEEQRDLLFEITVGPTESCSATQPVLEWRLEYQNLLTDLPDIITESCLLSRPSVALPCPPHPLLDEQRNRLAGLEALRTSHELAEKGCLEQARQVLEAAMAAIRDSVSGGSAFCATLLEDLQECYADLETQHQYCTRGTYNMCNTASNHGYQRSCGMKQRYANINTKSMIERWQKADPSDLHLT